MITKRRIEIQLSDIYANHCFITKRRYISFQIRTEIDYRSELWLVTFDFCTILDITIQINKILTLPQIDRSIHKVLAFGI